MEQDELPYGFDLLHDIKTYQELNDRLQYLTRELQSLLELVDDHKIAAALEHIDGDNG